MKGKILSGFTVTIRRADGNASGIVSLKSGDVVYGDVTGTWPRIYFNKVYRVAGNIEILGSLHNSVTQSEAGVKYMALTPEAEPGDPPPPVPDPFPDYYTLTSPDGQQVRYNKE